MLSRAEKIQKVLALWDAKMTSYQIAVEVGITRNAVMGIVHRAGKRRNPPKIFRRVQSSKPRVAVEKPAKPKIEKKRAAPKPKTEKFIVFEKYIKATEPFPELTFGEFKGKRMLELGPFDCRWIWDDKSYCGRPAVGCSYCPEHKAIVYTPPRKKENA